MEISLLGKIVYLKKKKEKKEAAVSSSPGVSAGPSPYSHRIIEYQAGGLNLSWEKKAKQQSSLLPGGANKAAPSSSQTC